MRQINLRTVRRQSSNAWAIQILNGVNRMSETRGLSSEHINIWPTCMKSLVRLCMLIRDKTIC